ncbi:MAG: Glu/Leu/Phe/Val dehydrogenase [Chlorobi bacterium]|nr:Glu/Leu/Phe/Val dehydrogenase [Chlorobiota bacterium]
MPDIFALADDMGPSKVIHVLEPSVGLRGVLVVDNVARGPSIGGLRMAPDVSVEECMRLARAMTLKNAAAGLPYGGGKSVIAADPSMPVERKEELIRAMARSLRNIEEYIFGPDMGTDETCMAWVRDEIGRAVALPRDLGGIPLDEIGATGWGLFNAVQAALQFCDFSLAGARVAVQGFGAVGMHVARTLAAHGALLVAASDSKGSIMNRDGLDAEKLVALKREHRSVADFTGGTRASLDDLIDVECDIWIPAARPDVIHEANVGRLRTKMVVQGANIPVTPVAESELHRRGIISIPDFIANAGGVICAAMEYRGSTEEQAMRVVAEKITENTRQVLGDAIARGVQPREAALQLALGRIRNAMGYRRYSLFSSAPGFI